MNQRSRLRVLVSAYATSPASGSEAAVGWNITRRLGRYHDVTVLYGARDHKLEWGSEVAAYLREHGPIPGVTFVAVDHPASARVYQWLHDKGLWLFYYWGYRAWQRTARKVAGELHVGQPFDFTYQLNMIGYREPGYLWSMPVPFVWGPVGGASNMPWPYFGQMGLRGRLFYCMRNLVNRLQMWLGGRSRKAAQRASHIWAVDDSAVKMIARWGAASEAMLETGTEIRNDARLRERRAGLPLQLCWSGRHIELKCLPILLHALSRIDRADRPQLTVLGAGIKTAQWKRLARRLGVEEIDWAGSLPHHEALERMKRADVFVHSSLQEATSNVVMEALSMGMPVICHDACGMAVAVTAECGIKVPLVDFDTSVRGFHSALNRLDQNPGLLGKLSQGALERAAELSWDALAERIARTFDVLADARQPSGMKTAFEAVTR